jgi:hypothetical protein
MAEVIVTTIKHYVGFEVFTAVVLKSIFFWDMTLKMEAIRSFETSGTTQRTTRRHIPEEDTLQYNTTFYDGLI